LGVFQSNPGPQTAVVQTAHLDKVQLMRLQYQHPNLLLLPQYPHGSDLQHFKPNEHGDDMPGDYSDATYASKVRPQIEVLISPDNP